MSATVSPGTLAGNVIVTETTDPIRVEHDHRGRWIAAAVGIALVAGATAGVVGVRAYSAAESTSPAGSVVGAPRTDGAESAHGTASRVVTGAGASIAGVGATTLSQEALAAHYLAPRPATDRQEALSRHYLAPLSAPVVRRTPPRGMADDAATTSTRRSDRPRNVQPGQPSGS